MEEKNLVSKLKYPRYYIPGIVLLFLFMVPLVFRNEYVLQVAIMILMFAYLGIGWNIIAGFAGQLSLGHAAFVGIGAYVSTLLFIYLDLTPWIGMFVGGVISAIFGVIVGYPCFKLRGPYYVLATIAYAELVRIFVQNTNEIGGIDLKGAQGLLVPLKGNSLYYYQFQGKAPYYYIILILMLTALYISYRIKKSKLGYYLAAIGDDHDAAESLGVNTTKMKLIAAAISSFLMAIGGTFYAQFLLYISPRDVFFETFSTEIALVGIIGGEGSVMGPVVGAFILTPLAELTRIFLGGRFIGVHLVVYGAILMAVVTYIPHGLKGFFEKYYYKLLARLGDPYFRKKQEESVPTKNSETIMNENE